MYAEAPRAVASSRGPYLSDDDDLYFEVSVARESYGTARSQAPPPSNLSSAQITLRFLSRTSIQKVPLMVAIQMSTSLVVSFGSRNACARAIMILN